MVERKISNGIGRREGRLGGKSESGWGEMGAGWVYHGQIWSNKVTNMVGGSDIDLLCFDYRVKSTEYRVRTE